MKKLLWFGFALMVFATAEAARAQNPPAQQTIILYSPIPHQNDHSRAKVDLQLGAYAPWNRAGDVIYGFARLGDDFDWFMKSSAQSNRSVLLDLDSFTVPWVEPLKPGEGLDVVVNSSGKDGKGSAGGYDGLSALPSTDGPGAGSTYVPSPRPRQPKRPAGVQTSANLLKANLDHIYVIHVVDDNRDFYALFRVDALQRGDNCTISWKMIPPPPPPTAVRK
jgi:hypothetical protein